MFLKLKYYTGYKMEIKEKYVNTDFLYSIEFNCTYSDCFHQSDLNAIRIITNDNIMFFVPENDAFRLQLFLDQSEVCTQKFLNDCKENQ